MGANQCVRKLLSFLLFSINASSLVLFLHLEPVPPNTVLLQPVKTTGLKVCDYFPICHIYLQTFVLVLPALLSVRVCFGFVLN